MQPSGQSCEANLTIPVIQVQDWVGKKVYNFILDHVVEGRSEIPAQVCQDLEPVSSHQSTLFLQEKVVFAFCIVSEWMTAKENHP